MGKIEIHYRRPPDRLDTFVQDLVVDRPEYKITLHEQPPINETIYVGGSRFSSPAHRSFGSCFPTHGTTLRAFT
jgi:hypothetical protein